MIRLRDLVRSNGLWGVIGIFATGQSRAEWRSSRRDREAMALIGGLFLRRLFSLLCN